ncbi:PB1 domain, AUX/IAA protein [Artemisia annua]|uniref:Auxin-responsive protein n=1 Tax=Artemisia annua TaxID=35608 RepID=A0A2U1MDE6_ARTAN|nr:PB1 domain, AUX/IAA protein [Artemisia annua]
MSVPFSQAENIVRKHGEENDVIGWPPVKSSRKKHFRHKNHGGNGGGGSKSMYVKVHMEGDGIARKIDLNLHHSYHTLGHTLAHMFGKCSEDVKLTYQDKEGDWLLAGDVPWRVLLRVRGFGPSCADRAEASDSSFLMKNNIAIED